MVRAALVVFRADRVVLVGAADREVTAAREVAENQEKEVNREGAAIRVSEMPNEAADAEGWNSTHSWGSKITPNHSGAACWLSRV